MTPPPGTPPPGTPPPGEPGPPFSLENLVYSQGFEDGPVSSQNTPGLRATSHPDIEMEWQHAVARTGAGAYHMSGGNLTDGDADIFNQARSNPFGGLEVWAGGAFYFTSFPDASVERPVWLIATVPTDGVQGADNKPIAAIAPGGRLLLRGSNSQESAELGVSIQRNRWYYLVLHGVNGVRRTQELYLYDGTSGAFLGKASLVLDVTGDFRNPLTKWGFGTSQDSSGLDYYLDDIYHAIGSANPGPLRIP